MKCIVIGAGNAGRPVARLLNYQNHDVTVTDSKKFTDFNEDAQYFLKLMENENININFENNNFDINDYDLIYFPPSLPKNSSLYKKISSSNIKILKNEELSDIVNSLINVDIIGITGTMGKTTTTFLTESIFKKAGFKTWTCSSLVYNLLSEAIINDIIEGKSKNCDVAIFELPHGTLGLLSTLNIKIGLLTNLNGDHLDEFEGSIEKYIERKLILEKNSENFISNNKCRDILSPIRKNTYYYSMIEDLNGFNVNFIGESFKDSLSVKYDFDDLKGNFKTDFYMMSYFFENALAASSIALKYGISQENIVNALSNFKGLPVHMEYLGDYNGRKVILDAAFLEEGMKKTLEYFSNDNLILFLDHFDTSTKRDKKDVGKLCGEYASVIIASAYNEFKKEVEINSAYEILDGVQNPNVEKIACDTIEEAAELTFKYSKKGDVILHIGPSIAASREIVTKKIKEGIESGSKKYQ
ncbi:MAG: UDP-N-acetylmuramoylalanine--D-glutamate ligase [Methanobacteriaceae archaeon]|jgi:UDP-N-acetylmuramoylalanine--D-glutamate ligase|nr:UDP-N-acetylmuramoylalanine--D-glutamate ligase [Methanobacteriaceae archaeon]